MVDRVNGAHVPELARKTVSHSQILGSFESTQQRPKEVSYVWSLLLFKEVCHVPM